MKLILFVLFLLFISCGNSDQDFNDTDSSSNDAETIDEETDDSEDDMCSDEDNGWDFVIDNTYLTKITGIGNEFAVLGFYVEPYDYGDGYYENVNYTMIAKLKSDFSVKWMTVCEEAGYGKDFGDFFVSEDGSVYAAGTNNSKEFLIVKINDSGEIVWRKEWQYLGFYVSGENRINSIKPVADGIYAGGMTSGQDEEGHVTFVRLYMSKIDYEGNLIWEKTWGPGGSVVGSIEIDNMENIYMTGYTVGSLDGNANAGKSGDCGELPWGPEGSSCPDPFLIKMNKNGEILWTKQFGSEDINITDFGIDVAVDNNGGVYTLSYSRIYGGNKIILRKFNESGKLIWQRIHDSKRNNYFEGTALSIDVATSHIEISDSFFENEFSKKEGRILSFNIENGTLMSELKYPLVNNVFFSGFVESFDNIKYAFGHEIVAFNQLSPDIYDIQPVYKAGIKKIDSLFTNSQQDKSITTGDEFERETISSGDANEDVIVFSFEDSENNIFFAGNILGSDDGKSIFISKYDKNRKLVWKKQYGSSKWDDLAAAQTDKDNNIMLAGTAYGDFEGKSRLGVGDVFVMKVNSSGEIIWVDQTGSNNDEWVNGIYVDRNGNIFVTGGTWGSLDNNEFSGGYGSDMFVGKWDKDGNKVLIEQWGQRIEGMGIAGDNNGSVFVVGRAEIDYGDQSVFDAGVPDSIIFKLDDKNLMEQWARIWGSEEVDSATGIAIDSAGDVFVTGYTFGPIDGNIQLGANCPGGYCPDAYLTKWDSTGKKKWTKQFGTENGDRASSIVIDEKDNIYISGTAGKNRLCEIESDIFLMKSDTSGNLDEIKIWGTAGEESVNSINISNGKIMISGFTTGGLDNNENKGGKDGFVTVIEK